MEVSVDAIAGRMDIVDNPAPRERMRAADSDRESVAEQLRVAHADGRLDLAEYDERVQQAWAARTYGELDVLTADLPGIQATPAAAVPAPRHQDIEPQGHHGRGGRAAVAAWASASAINLVIWAIVCLSTMSWIYPWWVWVAGPWGAMLLAGRLSRRGGPRRLPG